MPQVSSSDLEKQPQKVSRDQIVRTGEGRSPSLLRGGGTTLSMSCRWRGLGTGPWGKKKEEVLSRRRKLSGTDGGMEFRWARSFEERDRRETLFPHSGGGGKTNNLITHGRTRWAEENYTCKRGTKRKLKGIGATTTVVYEIEIRGGVTKYDLWERCVGHTGGTTVWGGIFHSGTYQGRQRFFFPKLPSPTCVRIPA